MLLTMRPFNPDHSLGEERSQRLGFCQR
ncbi:MAG: hypothetical protein ACLRNT_20235 [[Clostridium] innocuum]